MPLRGAPGVSRAALPTSSQLLPSSHTLLTGPARNIGCCGAKGPGPRANLHLVLCARSQRRKSCAVHLCSHSVHSHLGPCLVQGYLVAVPAPGSMNPRCPELSGAFAGHIHQQRSEGGCKESKEWGTDKKTEQNLKETSDSLSPSGLPLLPPSLVIRNTQD